MTREPVVHRRRPVVHGVANRAVAEPARARSATATQTTRRARTRSSGTETAAAPTTPRVRAPTRPRARSPAARWTRPRCRRAATTSRTALRAAVHRAALDGRRARSPSSMRLDRRARTCAITDSPSRRDRGPAAPRWPRPLRRRRASAGARARDPSGLPRIARPSRAGAPASAPRRSSPADSSTSCCARYTSASCRQRRSRSASSTLSATMSGRIAARSAFTRPTTSASRLPLSHSCFERHEQAIDEPRDARAQIARPPAGPGTPSPSASAAPPRP